jgi:hypothetical protein
MIAIMRVLRPIGRAWLWFVVLLGTVQMMILLFVVYWLLIPFFAIPFKILSDPFDFRATGKIDWTPREPVEDWAIYMGMQY